VCESRLDVQTSISIIPLPCQLLLPTFEDFHPHTSTPMVTYEIGTSAVAIHHDFMAVIGPSSSESPESLTERNVANAGCSPGISAMLKN